MPVLVSTTARFNSTATLAQAGVASGVGAVGDTAASAGTLPGDLTVTGTTSTTTGNLTLSTPGTLLENRLITGSLSITANNITVRNCRVRLDSGASWGVYIQPGVTGTYLDKVEIGGGSNGTTNTGVSSGLLFGDAGSGAVTNVANNVWIHHCIDGIRADGRCRFQWGRVSHMDTSGYRGDGAGSHGDGSQSTGWGDIEFLNSEIDAGNNDALFFNKEGTNPAIGRVKIDYCRVVGKNGSQPFGPPNTWQSSYGIRITAGGPIHVTNTDIDGTFDGTGSAPSGWATWTNNRRNGTPVSAP